MNTATKQFNWAAYLSLGLLSLALGVVAAGLMMFGPGYNLSVGIF